MHLRSLPAHSWEMRWYRQVTRELVRDELADLVALAHEKVIDPAHDGDPRMRHRRLELGARSELIALGRDDEHAPRDVRKGSRREGHVLQSDANKSDRVGRAAAREVREDLERAEAVADQPERETLRERPRVSDRSGEADHLIAAGAPRAVARAHSPQGARRARTGPR